METTQDFEIISLDHPDYLERMDAIDHISDFKILEEIVVTDEYLTVRMKAFDKITELYGSRNKYEKMLKLLKEIDFLEWIPFQINELKRNNGIELTIRRVVRQYDRYTDNRLYTLHNIIIGSVNVMILPHYIESYIDGKRIRNNRHTQYGMQYQYEMVVRVLLERENGELYYEYVYAKCFNAHENTHIRFYNKIMIEEIKQKKEVVK